MPQLSAQNSISGKVIDHNNDAIYFATLALYHAKDSTVSKAISTEADGRFTLNEIPDGDYYLEANMLGFATKSITGIQFPLDNNRNIDIQLVEDATTLSTIEVTAKVPLLEQRSDRLIVNVENNMTSLNGNLLDVMKKVPGMMVINDRLSMAGQSNITILINGKSTRYMDIQSLLRDMPGDNIKRVEIIHQPGAEFEASGTGPVINIILKKNSLYGTNGKLSLGVGKGEFWRYRTGLNLSHYQGKVNINANLGYSRNAWYEELLINRKIQGDIYDQHNIDPAKSTTFRSGLSLDWNVSDKHRIGISSRFFDGGTKKVAENTTNVDYLQPEKQDLQLITNNNTDRSWDLIIVNPYYTFEIDTLGQKLEVDFNYAQFKRDGISTLSTTEQNIGGFFPGTEYKQPGTTTIYTTKLDYTYPLSKAVSIQAGGKYSEANLDNDLKAFYESSKNEWVENTNQSNRFLFDETIAAAYAKLTFNKGDWSGTAGLRYEGSQSKGTSVTMDSTLSRTIKKVFPSASLSRKITNEISASLAYSYRIDRPRYSSLNPFVYYWDPYTYEEGNPLLRPALTHSLKLNLTYESQPFFSIEYKKTSDAMVDFSRQDDDTGAANATMINLESLDVFNASLFFPLDFIPGVSGYGGVIANNSKFHSTEGIIEQFDRNRWSYTAFLQTEFTLPGKINAEVGGWYNSGGQEGIMTSEWLYGVSMGFSKKFMDDKAKLSIGVDDIFNRFWHAKVDYANIDADIISKWAAPVVNMQFSYTFGNRHMKSAKRNKNSGSEEINRAAGD